MIVGQALARMTADPEIADAVFQILETQRLLDSKAPITLVPRNSPLLAELLAANPRQGGQPEPTPKTGPQGQQAQ